ncbi:MAG: polysaccharide biosynthesis C-terminal domain-containing protein [Clostridiales bacterium]|nr:polysaccharide biosynthesis C-terminal domain-containing protein [Clostridiales bacterium]
MLKTIIKFSVSNIVNLFLGVLSAIVLTRAFSPTIYGTLNIFNATVATGLSILYLGLDSSFIRFYNEPPSIDTNKELGTKLLFCSLLVTIIVSLVSIFVLYNDFSTYIFGFSSRIIVCMVFVSIIAQIVLRFLNIKYRMDFNTKQFTIQAILTQSVLKLFVIISALLAFNIEGVVSFSALSIMILAIVYSYVQRKSFFSFKNFSDYTQYKPVFKFAAFSAPLSICINLNTSLTQQIISHSLNVSSVGIYSSAGYFASILGALQGGFSTFWSAYMYSNYRDKQENIKKINEYLLLVIIIVYACLILGKDIVYLLIGQEYQESKSFFSMTLSYPILMLAAETTTYGIGIMKKTQYSLVCFIVSICLNLGLAYLFIPFLGLKGAAMASMLSGLVLYISRSIIGQKLYKSISDIRITIIDIIAIICLALVPAFLPERISYVAIIIIVAITIILNFERTKDLLRKFMGLLSDMKINFGRRSR